MREGVKVLYLQGLKDLSGGGKVTFNKTATLTIEKTIPISATVEIGWIEGEKGTEPATPDGYERAADFDMDYGVAGFLYAYKKIS